MLNQRTFEVADLANARQNPIIIVGDYINTLEPFIALDSTLYCWNDNYYDQDIHNKLNGLIQRICSVLTLRYSGNLAREIYQYLCDNSQVNPWDVNSARHLIPFRNGWFNITLNTLTDPDSTIFLTYQFNWDYSDTADCPIFQRTMETMIPIETDRRKILTFLAYTFTNRVDLQKSLMLYGRGSNGKSLLMDTVNFIFGNLSSHIMLQNLGDRFNKIIYNGKLINIADDIPHTPIKDDGFIKMLVTNEILSGEKKGKQPLDYKNSCKLVCTCNQIPRPDYQTSDGFYRRWIVIALTQRFGVNPTLMNDLKGEVLGIIKYILSFLPYMDELRPYNIADTKAKWYMYGESTLQFFHACDQIDGCYTQCSELYKEYLKFCKDGNYSIANKKWFGSVLASEGISKIQRKLATASTPQWVYEDIEFLGVI